MELRENRLGQVECPVCERWYVPTRDRMRKHHVGGYDGTPRRLCHMSGRKITVLRGQSSDA